MSLAAKPSAATTHGAELAGDRHCGPLALRHASTCTGKAAGSNGIGSAAMQADSRQTDFCTYLSAILLGGLLLNAVLGWWWTDPVAGLVMIPIIAKEGIDGLRAKACCGDGCESRTS